MSRTLETTTGSDIFIKDIGITVIDGEPYDIHPNNFTRVAASEEIVTLINDGDILVKFLGEKLDTFEALALIKELILVIRDVKVDGNSIQTAPGITKASVFELDFQGNVSATLGSDGLADIVIGGGNKNLGSISTITFSGNGTVADEYLGHPTNLISGNSSLAIVPWASKLVAITFTNSNRNVDCTIIIERASFNGGTTKNIAYEKELENVRIFTANNLDVSFSAGDKIAVYIQDDGGNASDVAVDLFFKITSDNVLDDTNNFNGDF